MKAIFTTQSVRPIVLSAGQKLKRKDIKEFWFCDIQIECRASVDWPPGIAYFGVEICRSTGPQINRRLSFLRCTNALFMIFVKIRDLSLSCRRLQSVTLFRYFIIFFLFLVWSTLREFLPSSLLYATITDYILWYFITIIVIKLNFGKIK